MTQNQYLRKLLRETRFWVDRGIPQGEDQHSDICLLLQAIDDVLENPTCELVIPGTVIMCGEDGNYCSQECMRKTNEKATMR